MISYLGEYPGARSNPIDKFKRAVDSYIGQTYNDKELIIISDGCDTTKEIYQSHYSNHKDIKFIWTPKSKSKWPGTLRQLGCLISSGEYICYLDADDCISELHLENAASIIMQNKEYTVFINKAFTIPFVASKDMKEIKIGGALKDKEDILKGVKDNEYEKFEFKSFSNKPTFKAVFLHENGIGTHQIFHSRKTIDKVSWKDTNNLNGGEDGEFIRNLINKYGAGMFISPTYYICHSNNSHDL